MAVIIGSARMGSNGSITGDKAGDNNGREVSTQNWYKHSKGWRVFRAKDVSMRSKLAYAMKAACANDNIGYDQNERNDLYYQIKSKGFDPAKATEKTETDCSALVRVCCCYAGVDIGNVNTSTEPSALLNSGKFTEMKGTKYTNYSDYLCAGDILCTKTKGHTVIVLTNGSKAEDETPEIDYKLGDRLLSYGCEGNDVKQLQQYLIQLGYSCGSYGADGDFGDATELAVKSFQRDHSLDADGEYGEKSHAALMQELEDKDIITSAVKIVGGNCYIRSEASTKGSILSTAHEGEVFEYGGETTTDGWNKIKYGNGYGWVSGKYSKLV